MRLTGISTAVVVTMVGALGAGWHSIPAAAADAPTTHVGSTVILAADADPTTPAPELAQVAPGGTLTLNMPALVGTTNSTATLTDAAGVTHQVNITRHVGIWEVELPVDLPDGDAFLNLTAVRIGQQDLPAPIPLGIEIRGTSPQQVSSHVRILAAAQYDGPAVTLTPGRETTITLQGTDPVMNTLLPGMGSLTARFGPAGSGTPFETTVPARGAAGSGLTRVTLPKDYPASQFPRTAPQLLRLAASHPSNPDIAFVALDVPVRLVPRYSTYVTKSYLQMAGRSPTGAELAAANRLIENARSPKQFAGGLTTSAAFRTRSITAIHRRVLGRGPSAAELRAHQRTAASGGLQAVEATILASAEFNRRAGSTTTGYVRAVSRATLGRNPSPAELRRWTSYVTRSRSRTPFARALTLSDTHTKRVLSPYQKALTGAPTSATTASVIGRNVRAGGRWESHLAGWLASPTWLQRAG